jgi:guanylate kinase
MTPLQFNRPTLITITGPTCSGKSTLFKELDKNGMIARIISTTTRKLRVNEKDGDDFFFISKEKSLEMEKNGDFFELIDFQGTRYGVTNSEMHKKMHGSVAAAVISEPRGLAIYEKKCNELGWGIFKVYVHTTEAVLIQRLNQRLLLESWACIDSMNPSIGRYSQAFQEYASENAKKRIADAVSTHTSRLLSITGDERRWMNYHTWDVIVPGDNLSKALKLLQDGVKWRNRRDAPPVAYSAVPLPLV